MMRASPRPAAMVVIRVTSWGNVLLLNTRQQLVL
jgi:hypothetical protein